MRAIGIPEGRCLLEHGLCSLVLGQVFVQLFFAEEEFSCAGGFLLWNGSPIYPGRPIYFCCLHETEALAFNRLNAQQLGERLLRWQGQNNQWVDSYKVKKAKKNKGLKRKQWWEDRQAAKGKEKGTKSTPPDGTGAPADFSSAPWNQPPSHTIEVKDDDEPVDPDAMEPLFKGPKDDEFDGALGPVLMPKIFGP